MRTVTATWWPFSGSSAPPTISGCSALNRSPSTPSMMIAKADMTVLLEVR